ncbi:myeloperoxidase-like [Scyliorhinus canicula]|uniref:myeloperoxidase-like n=1 Tax=Scyliorhinus canicula TaxID=7830 RepID=UPI0018F71CDE|nr:myeloperoxidase-like [Scyliorhinus canicula]
MLPVWFLSVFLTGYSLFQTITGSEETLGSPFVNNSVQQAIKLVDRAYKESRASMKQKLLKRSASISDLMTFSKQPVAKTRNVARSAEYLQMTLSLIRHSVHRIHKRSLNISDIITSNDLNHIFQSTGCSSLTRLPDCPKDPVSDLYRTINGQCNNRISPLLGASDIPLKRWLRAEYEDGFSLARGSSGKCYSGYPLPLVIIICISKIIEDPD